MPQAEIHVEEDVPDAAEHWRGEVNLLAGLGLIEPVECSSSLPLADSLELIEPDISILVDPSVGLLIPGHAGEVSPDELRELDLTVLTDDLDPDLAYEATVALGHNDLDIIPASPPGIGPLDQCWGIAPDTVAESSDDPAIPGAEWPQLEPFDSLDPFDPIGPWPGDP